MTSLIVSGWQLSKFKKRSMRLLEILVQNAANSPVDVRFCFHSLKQGNDNKQSSFLCGVVVLVKALYWTAPELLRSALPLFNGTQPGDMYSVALLVYYILYRIAPYETDDEMDIRPKGLASLLAIP